VSILFKVRDSQGRQSMAIDCILPREILLRAERVAAAGQFKRQQSAANRYMECRGKTPRNPAGTIDVLRPNRQCRHSHHRSRWSRTRPGIKPHVADTCRAFRSCSQAAISSMSVCLSEMRRSRHWHHRTLMAPRSGGRNSFTCFPGGGVGGLLFSEKTSARLHRECV
jgi:hypothetical protein